MTTRITKNSFAQWAGEKTLMVIRWNFYKSPEPSFPAPFAM